MGGRSVGIDQFQLVTSLRWSLLFHQRRLRRVDKSNDVLSYERKGMSQLPPNTTVGWPLWSAKRQDRRR
jgi:hypothetical protein